MTEGYLWDKSGEPDPEVERLENLLGPFGHKPGDVPNWRRPVWKRWPVLIAMAASLVVIFGALWMVRQRNQPAWEVAALQGKPSVTRLRRGQSLNTDSHSRARLDLADFGQIEVEPDTKLSVVAMKPEEQRLALARGTIHAVIWAPPGRFYVNTPSAQTLDLGCEYTLQVDRNGVGLVRVQVGWVAFENDGRESFIPADAACVTRPGRGPGIPYYEDAPAALIAAVGRFDQDASVGAVDQITSEARPRDAITLWHLMRRVAPADRGRVYDRLAQFITTPAGVTREGILAGDAKMVDAIWDTLDLGNTSWWRTWKSRGPK